MIKIDDLGMNGEGIAHDQSGKAMFIPFLLPGEIFDGENFLEASPHRVTPKCPYYKTCGGCALQHLSYAEACKFKTKKVQTCMDKNKVRIEVFACVPSENEYFYRNKITLQSDGEKLGLYEIKSHKIVEINECKIASKEINLAIKLIRKYLEIKNIKNIIIHGKNNQIIITINLAEKLINKVNADEFAAAIKINFSEFGINFKYKNKIIKSYGLEALKVCEFNIKYNLDNNSFYQINDQIKNLIYSKVLSEISEGDRVLDLYSGGGLMSGIVSQKASSVIGVEIDKFASANAEALKKANNLTRLKNINDDCAKVVLSLPMSDVVILDPPRAGCDRRVLDALLKSKPNKIIYISCSPQTLARDLKILEVGYEILSVTPYDMFPQTAHVESLCVLRSC